MYTAKIENSRGDVLRLSGNEPKWQIMSITGLNPPRARLNVAEIVGRDGGVFNLAKLETRNIVIMLKINGDAEANRLELERYFVTKEDCRFYYAHGSLDVFIDGKVEACEYSMFSARQVMQISIICAYPYFSAMDLIIQDASGILPLFTFPFTIDEDDPVVISELDSGGIKVNNTSDTAIGCEIVVTFSDSASEFALMNVGTGQTMVINYAFLADDVVRINTKPAQKSIRLLRSGAYINLLGSMAYGSTFFQLESGMNFFSYTVDNVTDSPKADVKFMYRYEYRGL